MRFETKLPDHGREEQSLPAAESAPEAPPIEPPKNPATSLSPCRRLAMMVAPALPIRTSPESPGVSFAVFDVGEVLVFEPDWVFELAEVLV